MSARKVFPWVETGMLHMSACSGDATKLVQKYGSYASRRTGCIV